MGVPAASASPGMGANAVLHQTPVVGQAFTTSFMGSSTPTLGYERSAIAPSADANASVPAASSSPGMGANAVVHPTPVVGHAFTTSFTGSVVAMVEPSAPLPMIVEAPAAPVVVP